MEHGEEGVLNDLVPAHFGDEFLARFDEFGSGGVGGGDASHEFIGDFDGDTGLDFIALLLGHVENLVEGEIVVELGVVGDDDVGDGFAIGDVVDETCAATDVGVDADGAAEEWFEWADAEGFVGCGAKFDIGGNAEGVHVHFVRDGIAERIGAPAKLVDEDDLDAVVVGVEVFDHVVEIDFGADEIGVAFAVVSRPAVFIGHGFDVLFASRSAGGGKDEEYGGLVGVFESLFEFLADADVSPDAFGDDGSHDVCHEDIGFVADEFFGVVCEVFSCFVFLVECNFFGGDAVVDEINVVVVEVSTEKVHFARGVVAYGDDAIADVGLGDECVAEVVFQVAEDLFDVEALFPCLSHGVVEHCVVAGMVFDDVACGGTFVGVEDGLEVFGAVEYGFECGGHAHEFV